jgi:hypothetical protein
MYNSIDTVEVPRGVKWHPKIKRSSAISDSSKKRDNTLSQMNKRLASTRAERLNAAEKNCFLTTGKKRF